jgi:hypothetical protein
MICFNVYRLIRKGTKNSDDVPIWLVSLETLGDLGAACPEDALAAARQAWPHVPRADILVGPGDQGSLVHRTPVQSRVHPRGISQHITREQPCPSH